MQKTPEIRRSSRPWKKCTSYEARQPNPNWPNFELYRTTFSSKHRTLSNQHQHAKQGGRQNSRSFPSPQISSTPQSTRDAGKSDNSPLFKPNSQYVLDIPRTTEESFSKNFEEAINILHSISPVRGISMMFQREKERIAEV